MSRSDVLLASITSFFEEPENGVILEDILKKKVGISLRKLEWFITNYSKEKNVCFGQFSVHCAYKSTLNGYSKKLFDPFCRTSKIEYKGMSTTVAQLNFIRWCIKNNIIKYIIDNKDHIFSHKPSANKSVVVFDDLICDVK